MDIGSSNVFRGFTGSRILVKVVNSLCFSMQTSIHISHFETTAGKFVAGNAMSFLFPFSISSSDLKQLAGMGIIFGCRLESQLIQAGGEQQKSHLGTKGHSKSGSTH